MKRPSSNPLGSFAQGLSVGRDLKKQREMDQFKGLLGDQLASGAPDQNAILAGLAGVYPMGAVKASGMFNQSEFGSLDPALVEANRSIRSLDRIISGDNFRNLSQQQQQQFLGERDYLIDQVQKAKQGSRFYGTDSDPSPVVETPEKPRKSIDALRAEVRSKIKTDSKGRVTFDSQQDLSNYYQDLKTEFGKNDADVIRVKAFIDKQIELGQESARQAESRKQESREDYRAYLDENLPNVKTGFNELNKVKSGLQSALTQAKRAPAGGAYVAMKKVLGDALSGADFAGVAGFDVQQGMLGKINELFGASQMSDEQSIEIVQSAVDSFNQSLAEYNDRFDDSTFGQKARKAYEIKPLEFDLEEKSTQGRRIVTEDEFFGGM